MEPSGSRERFDPGLPGRVVAVVRRDLPLAALDLAAVFAAYFVPLVLRFGGEVPDRYWRAFWSFGALAVAVHLLSNYLLGLYGQMWRFASVQEARRVLLAGCLAGLAVAGLDLVPTGGLRPLPMSVVALGATLSLGAVGAIRFQSRLFGFRRRAAAGATRRVLLMGAGEAGAMVLREMLENPWTGLDPVGLIDDDPRKAGISLHGLRVLGPRSAIPGLVGRLGVDEVLLAIPSAPGEVVRDVAALCEEVEVPLRVLPSRRELLGGRVGVRDIRDLRIEDLLGRRQVETDLRAVSAMVRGRRVLVTGAGGSIGSEVSRQVAALAPAALLLLDHDETHLHDVLADLGGAPATPVLADVRDRDRVLAVFEEHAPEVVFHAAAHKHVPLLERHPEEALATNVLGTANVADAALAFGARRFVLISTDKAVRSANVMGASKWLAEQVVRSLDGAGCAFCAVRFGNVLGSRGSVIPSFLRQIERGGPVTVTHPAMARYFMSVREAVELVLQAAAMARGGEVFTLEMGEPVNILDLARKLIRLSGKVPGRDVPVEIVGPRPGEKLVEELAGPGEDPAPSEHPGILVSRPPRPRPAELRAAIRELEGLARARALGELAARMKGYAAEGFQAAAGRAATPLPRAAHGGGGGG